MMALSRNPSLPVTCYPCSFTSMSERALSVSLVVSELFFSHRLRHFPPIFFIFSFLFPRLQCVLNHLKLSEFGPNGLSWEEEGVLSAVLHVPFACARPFAL